MIRGATPADLPRLFALVQELHQQSIYTDVQLADRLIRSMLFDGLRRHGGDHAGSTLLNVVEFRGKVEGFLLAILQPLYSMAIPLEAMDMWLYCTPKSPGIGASRLIDEYVAWAAGNPKVREIRLSWTDAVSVDPRKIGKLYRRKGFIPCGEIYRKVS